MFCGCRVCIYLYILCVCVCVCFDWFGLCTLTALCFDRVHSAITVNSVVQPNNGVRFPLLQVQGACYTVIFASLLLSVSPLISSSPPPPPMFLSRGLVTAVKPCIKALTYSVLPLLLPLSLPPWFYPSTLCWSVTPPQQLHWPALPLQRSYLQLMLWSW